MWLSGNQYCALMQNEHGMHKLLDEIEQSVHRGLYYVAMIGLLTVPDQMAALSDSSGKSNRVRYERWYKRTESDMSAGTSRISIRLSQLKMPTGCDVRCCTKLEPRQTTAQLQVCAESASQNRAPKGSSRRDIWQGRSCSSTSLISAVRSLVQPDRGSQPTKTMRSSKPTSTRHYCEQKQSTDLRVDK